VATRTPAAKRPARKSAPAKSAVKKTAVKKPAAHLARAPAKRKAAEAAALKRHAETDGSAPARQFTEPIVLRDGSPALMRAIRPDDRERLQTAFLALDRESVYLRYFMYKRELTEAAQRRPLTGHAPGTRHKRDRGRHGLSVSPAGPYRVGVATRRAGCGVVAVDPWRMRACVAAVVRVQPTGAG